MIEPWLQLIRDHPRRPPGRQCHVLTMLALRMDFSTGQGFASVRTLMDDSDVSSETVKRATRWARNAELLKVIRRGHRRGDGSVTATEWLISTGQGRPLENLKGSVACSQRVSSVTYHYPSLHDPKLSVLAIAEVLRLTGQEITREHAERGIRIKLDGKRPDHPGPYLKKIIGDDPHWWLPTKQPPPLSDVLAEYSFRDEWKINRG